MAGILRTARCEAIRKLLKNRARASGGMDARSTSSLCERSQQRGDTNDEYGHAAPPRRVPPKPCQK